MPSIADMKLLRDAYSAHSELRPSDALQTIGNPSPAKSWTARLKAWRIRIAMCGY